MDQPDHEGQRLHRLLTTNGKTAKDFRLILGVSDPAVRKPRRSWGPTAIMDAPPEERRTLRLIVADRLDPRRK